MARRDPLSVWMYGRRIAELTSRRPGEVVCRYTDEALESWPGNTPLLSCSLPLTRKRQQAGVFFGGVLPEGQHRQALAAEARVPTYDTFGLLARFGKDIAGAAVIAYEDPGERPGDVVRYTAAELEEEVSLLPDHPLGIHDDSELSLAGLQDKMLLVDLGDGSWGRPTHGRASTHILKTEDRRFPGMAPAEVGCLQLAGRLGLTTVSARALTLADTPCVIISRFDRAIDSAGEVRRIHQEDACQALGRDPELQRGRGKYESAGGPSFRDVAALLERFTADPEDELVQLARVATFIVLTGNADAHGKNIAVVHPSAGSVELAPLYDTVPTALWPGLRPTGAMAMDGRWQLDEITRHDVVAEAAGWAFDPARAEREVVSTATALVGALDDVDVPDPLDAYIRTRAERFLA